MVFPLGPQLKPARPSKEGGASLLGFLPVGEGTKISFQNAVMLNQILNLPTASDIKQNIIYQFFIDVNKTRVYSWPREMMVKFHLDKTTWNQKGGALFLKLT